jgi:protein-disulfide isomerase
LLSRIPPAATIAVVALILTTIIIGRNRASPLEPITIVEYGDFQCPSCARFALEHWPKVVRRFGENVVLDFRHWPQPYHPFALSSALAAECARVQGRFTEMHDLLFQQQGEIGVRAFASFAEEAGVSDIDAFRHCMDSSAPGTKIAADIRAAMDAGAMGTPALVIDGVTYRLRTDTNWLPHLLDSLIVHRAASVSRR